MDVDPRDARSAPLEAEDPVGFSDAPAKWQELTHAVSAALPDRAPDRWLGQLVFEVQMAADRATAMARDHGESVVAAARAEARTIREEGRRRASAATQRRYVMRLAAGGRSRPAAKPDLDLVPPRPRVSSRRPPPADIPPVTFPFDPATGADRPDPVPRSAPRTREPGSTRVPTATPAAFRSPSPSTTPVATPGPRGGPWEVQRPVSIAERDTVPCRPVDCVVKDPAPSEQALAEQSLAVPTEGSADTLRPPEVRRGLRIRPTAMLTAVAIILAALGLSVFERWGTAAQERASQKRLVGLFAATAATKRADPRPADGGVLGLLTVPRVAVDGEAVVEGATLGALHLGPAHDAMSSLPGQRGAVVILGHRRTYGGPFGRLGELRTGDVVLLRTTSGLFVYRVSRNPQFLRSGSQTLELPTASEVRAGGGAADRGDQALVLATGIDNRGTALEVVVATLDQASAAGNPVGATANLAGTPLRSVPGDGTGLVFLVLWGAILAGIVYFHRRLRSKAPLPLLVATGSITAALALYQIYLAVDRLLPGTY